MIQAIFLLVTAFAGCGRHADDDAAPSPRIREDAPLAISVFGDSVASGMFADTALGEALTPAQARHFAQLYRLSLAEDTDSERFYVDAQRIAAAPAASAFSGTAPYALASRLEAASGGSVGIFRYAISGSTTGTFPSQLDALDQDNAAGLRQSELALLNVGANDFCDRIDAATFRDRLRADVERLLTALPTTKLLLTPIPPVVAVMSLADGPAFAAEGIKANCADVRSTMKLCERRAIMPGASPESVAADVADWQALNAAMGGVVKELAASSEFSGRVALAAVGDGSPERTDLAIDCFHPGRIGHAKLAEAVWPSLEKLWAPAKP